MERSEKYGLGIALGGHVVLFGLLSVGFLATPNPLKLKATPIEVTLSNDVALEAEAPQATEAPATSQAPEQGPPEESAPPAPAEAAPEPEPLPPTPAPPKPAPKPVAKAPPKPPQKPTPPAAKPQPKQVAQAPAKPKAAPAKPAATASTIKPRTPPTAKSGSGANPTATAARARGSRLGADFLKGISDQPTKSQVQTPRAAKVGARDLASIAGLIRRQVQPCYDLGPLAGTAAMDIVTVLRLQFRRDGSIAAATVSDQDGVNGDNSGYAKQMAELSRRAVIRCAPLKGLPPELYEGGWADFDMGFIPRQLG